MIENHQTNNNVKKTPASVKKKEFAHVVSRMDHSDLRSSVQLSEFRGLYNLAIICGSLYAIATPLSNFLSNGVLHNSQLLISVFFSKGLVEVLATFASQIIFSFTALIPVLLYSRMHKTILTGIHHILQTSLFGGTAYWIYVMDWNLIHSVSAFVECLVLLMKMHSYIRTKFDIARTTGNPPTADIREYFHYLTFPTLVYETSYPRTERIRWTYLLEKFIALTAAIGMMYFIVTDYILPILHASATVNPLHCIIELLLPFIGSYLLIWFIIFECICNGIAEATRFADRDFYEDWWNSTTFDEYARKWNKPVHEFLLRHVYLESLEAYKLSKQRASTFTFLFSAALHECLFVTMFRFVRLYFFCLQMLQVALIVYGRGLKGTRLGNFVFWFGIILGPPMQAVIYSREFFGGSSLFFVAMVPTMSVALILIAVISFYRKRTTKDANPKPKAS